jgi:hypothetical protein
MLDLGRLYFNRDGRLAAPEVLDPFVVTKNPQRLGDRLVDAAGTNFNRMFNFLKIETGNFAGLQSHNNDLPYSIFLRQTTRSKTSGFQPPLFLFPNTIKYISELETRRGRDGNAGRRHPSATRQSH